MTLDDIREERWNLMDLGLQSALEWTAKRGLIPNSLHCPNCQIPCHLVNFIGIDGKKWRCHQCGLRRSRTLHGVRSDCFITIIIIMSLLQPPGPLTLDAKHWD
ncbi:hypothetical protein GQR58_015992 [Nymphon striatum]|nr:hypothetical protein GQR58_015992 [Nymphon striatum]